MTRPTQAQARTRGRFLSGLARLALAVVLGALIAGLASYLVRSIGY